MLRLSDESGHVCLRRHIRAGVWERFSLPPGRYTVRAVNCSGLDPGGITKWLCLVPGRARSLVLLFSPPLRLPAAVPVRFLAADAAYPGITPINGGITICQHPNTPSPSSTAPLQ